MDSLGVDASILLLPARQSGRCFIIDMLSSFGCNRVNYHFCIFSDSYTAVVIASYVERVMPATCIIALLIGCRLMHGRSLPSLALLAGTR